MAEQQVTGVCTEVVQKPGSEWVEFHIDGGGKYPVKMSTKLSPLIELGKAAGSNLATWTYNEVDSGKPNPHKPGSNFVNKYLERVEVGGAQTQTDASDSPAAQKGPALGADKDRLIVRQVAIKAAAELYAGDMSAGGVAEGADPPLAVMKAADRFECWIFRDMDEVPF